MRNQTMKPNQSSSYDETIDILRPSEKPKKEAAWAMQLVQGSMPALSSETNDLLTRRVRAAWRDRRRLSRGS